jgi:hypothetical protein
MRPALAICKTVSLLIALFLSAGAAGCGAGESVEVETTVAAQVVAEDPSSTTVPISATTTTSEEDRLRSRAEEFLALLRSIDEPTPENVASIQSFLVTEDGADERAAQLAERNAAETSDGMKPDELVEIAVGADGASGVARLRDYYQDQDGQPTDSLVDTDWRLVEGEWYRTLENGRAADGPITAD